MRLENLDCEATIMGFLSLLDDETKIKNNGCYGIVIQMVLT